MKKLVLLFTACTLIFAGCNKEPQDMVDQEHEVVISVSTGMDATSLLKSAGTPQEQAISGIITIYGYNSSNVYVDKIDFDQNATGGMTQTISIKKSITKMYAIANYFGTLPTSPTVATLEGLTANMGVSMGAQPASPFLMSGIGNVTAGSVSIGLVRAVAKVAITSTADFTINSIQVRNTPNLGYVFGRSPLAMPSGSGFSLINYAVNSNVNSTTAPILYVAENTYVGAVADQLTTFQVVGEFLGNTATYNIILKQTVSGTTNNIAITRNNCYNLVIKPVTVSDYTITINVIPWNDVNADDYLAN